MRRGGAMAVTTQPTSISQALAPGKMRLGEVLPVFCEKCGYILHGLPITRCEHCSVLQFQCPECGHHQPINTLRPAFQQMLGRLRAAWLALVVLIKINYFGWLSLAWFAGGAEWSYTYRYQQIGGNWQGAWTPYRIDWGDALGMMILGALFGAVGRMLLLRWLRCWLVGLILAAWVALMMIAGAQYQAWDQELAWSPLTVDFFALAAASGLGAGAGGAVVWWIWVGLVHLFLPKRWAGALLDWQRAMWTPRVTELARE